MVMMVGEMGPLMHTTPGLREGSPQLYYTGSSFQRDVAGRTCSTEVALVAASPPPSRICKRAAGEAARGRRRWDHRDRNRVLWASLQFRCPDAPTATASA